MKWEGNRESDNVEDARGGGGGGGGGFGFGGRSIGLGTVAVAVVAGWMFGINPLTILSLLSGGGSAPMTQQAPAGAPPAGDKQARFVSVVLADTEDVWRGIFSQAGATYREPKLRLYRGQEPTACGTGSAAMGPFYCPGDEKVYLDLDFFDTLRSRLGAPGEFAEAYVIAHEVGHHVQKLTGITQRVDSLRARGANPAQVNAASVRLELQADCYAGIWANKAQNARQILEKGDIESALNAASQIGDDTLQRKSQGRVVPESFTHGTSAQRVSWFTRGYETGSVQQCDTFKAAQL
ncbi:MAG: metalloprotease [Rhizobacter sp.]|nr:metalloprotease [Rhizobacter sp.]